ncbi:MAG TPA: glycosyltransferase [bacterium]|nr:glycosyltransferase [bacterium]
MLPENPRIAIVTDWLHDRGGAELVLEHLLELFPQADIYTSSYDPSAFPFLNTTPVHTSFIERLPFFRRRPKLASILRPYAFESFDLSGYDLVLSSASAESKGVITKPETLHICYCHTPTRYYWSQYHEYLDHMEFGVFDGVVRTAMPILTKKLREWDVLASMRVDTFIANSHNTARRIGKYYRRESEVIHPGIDTTRFSDIETREEFYLALGRVIPYKRFDLLVDTFAQMPERRLVIATSVQTPYVRELMDRSTTNVEWVFGVNDTERRSLYGRAKAYIMPQEEDFGLTPVEAMACGTPVIAYGRGGALETLIARRTGVFFGHQTIDAVRSAIIDFERLEFDSRSIRARAEEFDKELFKKRLDTFVREAYRNHSEKTS